ncbi:ty3-gypsy retrotransposon protein [Tanacetum coccineum]|uniref:Ty3-gypsy retrotransposon protein n=1 Tax=Tanacetum coccineum TaxID=301880 RepID=A0ABQ5FIJ1_9ASTR
MKDLQHSFRNSDEYYHDPEKCEHVGSKGAQNNQGARNANQFSRLAKVEFPKFSGEDVMGWIFKCDPFFLIDNTPKEEKVKIIFVHLFDKALLWHRQLIKTKGENVSWNDYKEAITERFGSIYEDPMAALKMLRGLPFIVETDASGVGLGAVLQQDGHPIAYISKSLAPKHQAFPTYKKDFWSLQLEIFFGSKYHYPNSNEVASKIIGFDYEVMYKRGIDNAAADAMSGREDVSELFTLSTTSISIDLYQRIVGRWIEDDHLQTIIAALQKGETKKQYALHNNQLLRKGKLVVGRNESLRQDLLSYFRDGVIGGHSGKCKHGLSAYSGLLQPLPIPKTVWSSISMDFIERLPKSHRCTVIFVVVDRLTKYGHFIPLVDPFTALQVAQVFLDQVCKLHGVPESIVSDRDKVFLSTFWKELFKLLHVKLLLSTSYHPQIDGQTEVVNRCLEGYLRCMTGEHPKDWFKWIPLAELWYNSNYHLAIDTTPFEALYEQSPPVHGKQNKFSPKYFRPFEVLAKVETVAYKLKLRTESQIHDVFYVSQLKKVHGNHHLEVPVVLPQVNKEGLLEVTPLKLLDRKIVKRNNVVVVYGLVQWSNGDP